MQYALAGGKAETSAVGSCQAMGKGHPGWAVPVLLPAEHGLCMSFPCA